MSMSNKAPEKIYLNPLLMEDGESIVRQCTFERQRDSQVEYTRTDAFIDKATEWLCNNYDKYIRVIGSSVYPAYAELCKDFQKAMKGE